MAIAILSKPADDSINSVYRPIVYEVECPDTSGSLELVRASVKLYINSSVVNNNNPIIQDPDLDQAGRTADHTKFTFDISGVARNYITSDLQTLGGEGYFTAPNSFKTLYIVVGAIYKSTSTNELSEASVAYFSGNECYIFNGVYQHIDAQNFTAFKMQDSSTLMLSNFPSDDKIKIKTDESYFFSSMADGTLTDMLALVVTKNSSGATIDTYKVDTAASSSDDKRCDVGVGCSNFANLVSGDMDSANTGTLPIITASVTTYDIHFVISGVVQVTKTYTFEIDRKCHDYSTRFHWLNRLGGYDSWTFDGASSRGQNQSKALYEQNLDYSFNIYDSETGINAIESKNTFSTYSGLLNNDKRKWLEELYTSPEVYVIEDGAYVPILITDSQVKTIDDDKKLIQVKINYTYSHQNVINV
mgnify:CR=1 FL=1|tara:strand:- start:742 stop:1989 length:1248 start_codon:yes stop_codon:yes gene_type:complete